MAASASNLGSLSDSDLQLGPVAMRPLPPFAGSRPVVFPMLAIDDPSVLDRQVEYGTFVVIAIDPVASVAPLWDEQATQEAAKIRSNRYLALVKKQVNFHFLPEAGAPRLSLAFQIVIDGLPKPPQDWAATPIAPAPAHPQTGREPVRFALARLTNKDNANYESDEEDAPAEVPEYEAAIAQAREYLREEQAQQPQPVMEDSVGMFDILPDTSGRAMKLCVEMWVDVNSIERPANPQHLRAEIGQLREIEWRWAQRVVAESLAHQPETDAWLDSISGADAPRFEADVADEALAQEEEDDMSITPEDAIEHRVERELHTLAAAHVHANLDVAASSIGSNSSSSPVLSSAEPPSTPAPEPLPSTDARSDSPAGDAVPKYPYGRGLATLFAGFRAFFSRIRPIVSRFSSLFLWTLRPFLR
ncbi:hypothetical protein EXIGLDRAFT_772625 [Exidia glandulosa HHB12029]|uniref:Uncharacterized protein n=1 Tax=Exidia glandulosa HHB12029 TaxID=1314781 RepID=A0A166A518_EXIGL|nr:hypothetical protein EXIGLDRAFT_772625 [Exidia glandulosa HHB12029]